jgi:hypothetical protein
MVAHSFVLTGSLLSGAAAHEYMKYPPSRTADALLNAVAFGTTLCKTDDGVDKQCNEDPLSYQHLFHMHPAYDNNACGGSPQITGWNMAAEGNSVDHPEKFDMTVSGPEATTGWTAGSEVELRVHGFFHQGVSRMALCFKEDSSCNHPQDFDKYVLGFHFTEGTAGVDYLYTVDMPFKVTLPNRNGKAVMQWLVDVEDVRAYVSCSDVELTGAAADGPAADVYTCNGHPLCNCNTDTEPTLGAVGLNGTCPFGTAASLDPHGSATGTGIVSQYKAQLSVEDFCGFCISGGCPSTCGGPYKGFYQGDKCTNEPVLPGCGNTHNSALPQYIACKPGECKSSGWTVSSDAMVV